MVDHPSSCWSAENSWPSVYFCLLEKSVCSVLRGKRQELIKMLKYLSLQAEATFYRLLKRAEMKVWLNPGENELEILWDENAISVPIITDVIIWFLPKEVSHFRTTCVSSIFFQILSSLSENFSGICLALCM